MPTARRDCWCKTSRLVSYEPVPIPSPHKRTAEIPLRSAKSTRYYRNPHRSAQWRGNSIKLSACFARADRNRTGDYFRRYRSTGNAGFKSQSLDKLSAQNKVLCALFLTNSAPMLLIDPSRDGQIVDANLAALNFYGYNHETMCQKHTGNKYARASRHAYHAWNLAFTRWS